jgi:predicted N-acetyltransferase YhbS
MAPASARAEHGGMIDTLPAALTVRDVTEADADACARIFYDAFAAIAGRHGHPVEPGSPDFTRMHVGAMLGQDGVHGLVAESDGRVVGSAWVDERSPVAGVGPVTVDPAAQDRGAGRALMATVLAREERRGAAGVRLVQTAYHARSLALYAKLGFAVREPLSVLQGTPPREAVPGHAVRPATEADVAAAAALCRDVHGFERSAELRMGIAMGTALVVEAGGEPAGYATGLGYGFHAVARTDAALRALLCAPEGYLGLGVLVPSRRAELLGWALDRGLRLVQQSTLMTIGKWREPSGAWLPSIVF